MSVIGHYAIGAKNYGDQQLKEINDQNFYSIISNVDKCPYSKNEDKTNYTSWKNLNLPCVYFTTGTTRPDKRISSNCSGYAVIDIDNLPNERITVSHPAVCCTNYTGNGTHIFFYTDPKNWGETPMQWQQTYNSIAYEIWNEIGINYKQVKFDGRCAKHTQGCYLWNTDWVGNPNFKREFTPTERYLTDGTILAMYDGYSRATCNEVYKAGVHNINKRYEKKVDMGRANNSLLTMRGVSAECCADFLELSRTNFLRKYEKIYDPIVGDRPVFTEYTDYEGNTYQMCETNGEMITLWNKYMKSRKGLATFDGHYDYSIKIGGRRRSLFTHLREACQFLEKRGGINADHILYDAVYWIVNNCEEGLKFPTSEITATVASALVTYSQYDDVNKYDHRTFISGENKVVVDEETGEITYKKMTRAEKIGANSKCRKMRRIEWVCRQWKPDLDLQANIDRIKAYGYENTDGMNDRTYMEYLSTAKNNQRLLDEYKWLAELELPTSKAGRKSQSITIVNIESGEEFEFGSKKECMEFFNTNYVTFSNFLKNKTKLNKVWTIKKL